ncbi:MAG: transposase [Candidatus Accumulibacter sp.]|jgi:putative transposase|nr:transposase [Accumulibacter sp.]
MLIAHKIALDLNDKQATYMARAAGCARFAYNWALAEWSRQYAAWEADNSQPRLNQMALRRQLNAVKKHEYPWMLEVTKCAPQLAIMQLGQAFQDFLAGRVRYPQFRKKGIYDRFSLSNDQFAVEGSRLRVPHLGWVRMRESLRFTGKLISATVSRVAERWYVSLAVETQDDSHLPEAENQGAAGVDSGIKALATLSTGESIIGPKPHKALSRRVRRLSRSLSRKQKGSRNRNKAKAKLSRLYARIASIRQDATHKLTTDLTRRFHTIGIEDWKVRGNVRGTTQDRRLARSIADMSFLEFRRQLDYKAAWRGGRVIVAERFPARGQTCPACAGRLDELPLSARQRTCPECGTTRGREVNAAIDLKNYAVSSTVSACGGEGPALVARQGRDRPQ